MKAFKEPIRIRICLQYFRRPITEHPESGEHHSWFKNKLGVREELTVEERGPPTTALRVKRDSADPALAKGRYDFDTI